MIDHLPHNTSHSVFEQLDGMMDVVKNNINVIKNSLEYRNQLSKSASDFQIAIDEAIAFFARCKCCERHCSHIPTLKEENVGDTLQTNTCELCCREKMFNRHTFVCRNEKCSKTFCKECLKKYNETLRSNRCPYCCVEFRGDFTDSMCSFNRLHPNDCRCGCRHYSRKVLRMYKHVSKKKNISVNDYSYFINKINYYYEKYYEDIQSELFIHTNFENFRKYQKDIYDSLPSDAKITKTQIDRYMKLFSETPDNVTIDYSGSFMKWDENMLDILYYHICKVVQDNPYMTLSDYFQDMKKIFEPVSIF